MKKGFPRILHGKSYMELSNAAFSRLVYMIHHTYGIDLHKKRTLVEGRLGKYMNDRGFSSLDDYLDVVEENESGDELVDLLNRLTTNHTYFMREPEHFVHFRDHVLPEIVKLVKDRDVRVWSAGCSSGQEPYTLYMLMDSFFSKLSGSWEYSVLATDISMRALDIAIDGIYDNAELEDIPAEWKKKYLINKGNGTSQFTEQVRKGIIYRPFNLMNATFPFKKPFHVIFCRNVMIYFDSETKTELVQKYYQHTASGGYLYIGQTESVARGLTNYHYVMPAVYHKD